MPIFFDLDGVLVDSETHWRAVDERFLQQLIPHWDAECQASILGMSLIDVYKHLCASHQLSLSKAAFLDHYGALAKRIYSEQSAAIDGMQQAISELQSAGFRLGVVSSSPRSWISFAIEAHFARINFEIRIGAEDVDDVIKPAPDLYRCALARANVPASAVVAIEDSQRGIRSALAAGIPCLGLLNGRNTSAAVAEATAIVEVRQLTAQYVTQRFGISS